MSSVGKHTPLTFDVPGTVAGITLGEVPQTNVNPWSSMNRDVNERQELGLASEDSGSKAEKIARDLAVNGGNVEVTGLINSSDSPSAFVSQSQQSALLVVAASQESLKAQHRAQHEVRQEAAEAQSRPAAEEAKQVASRENSTAALGGGSLFSGTAAALERMADSVKGFLSGFSVPSEGDLPAISSTRSMSEPSLGLSQTVTQEQAISNTLPEISASSSLSRTISEAGTALSQSLSNMMSLETSAHFVSTTPLPSMGMMTESPSLSLGR